VFFDRFCCCAQGTAENKLVFERKPNNRFATVYDIAQADFGMTVVLPKGANHFQGAEGARIPIKWCGIEVLQDRKFSSAADVWAFGVLCWEVFA
jgi:hypothetical protein